MNVLQRIKKWWFTCSDCGRPSHGGYCAPKSPRPIPKQSPRRNAEVWRSYTCKDCGGSFDHVHFCPGRHETGVTIWAGKG